MFASPSLRVPVPAKGVKKLFVHESREAAVGFLQRNKLTTDSTPLLVPFKTDKNVIKFLKPSDGDPKEAGCIRIMGARNELRDKNLKGRVVNWVNRELLRRDFAPHLNDLMGDDVLLEENGLIVIYQRVKQEGGGKNIGAAFAKFFREEQDLLIKKIKDAESSDEVDLNMGSFTQGLTVVGMDIDVAAGMTYFIKDGEVFRHTFRAGVSTPITDYLHAESAAAQEVRINYNKTENNHVLSFLKDWAKGTVFAAITAVGAGIIASIFLIAVISAAIAVTTFVILSVIAFCKASKDNQKTIDFGNPEFEIIEPEKQKNSIFNQLKFDFLMVMAYLRGKSSEIKQPVNQVTQPVQNEAAADQTGIITVKSEMAALQPSVTEQTKEIPVIQNPIPRVMPVHTIEERSSIPVMKIEPIRTTALPKQPRLESSPYGEQPVNNSTSSFFKKPAVKKVVKGAERALQGMGGCSQQQQLKPKHIALAATQCVY